MKALAIVRAFPIVGGNKMTTEERRIDKKLFASLDEVKKFISFIENNNFKSFAEAASAYAETYTNSVTLKKIDDVSSFLLICQEELRQIRKCLFCSKYLQQQA